jgi:hypothetical protein
MAETETLGPETETSAPAELTYFVIDRHPDRQFHRCYLCNLRLLQESCIVRSPSV